MPRSGLACGTPSRSTPSPLSPPRRTYAQFTTGLARARLPVGNPHRSFATGTTPQEGDTKCLTATTTDTHGNGTGNGLVHVNGNGHKLDAAIVSEHELLWDGLSPAVTNALGHPIDPALVSQRKGRAGRTFSYIEGHVAISEANRVFGFGGWGYEMVRDVTLRRIETVDPQTGEIKTTCAYSAPVRVTVAGARPRTDIGVHPVAEDTLDGHDTAIKGAVTDGLKRALRSFGDRFGNGLYGDQAPASGPPRPDRAPAQPRAVSAPANVATLRKRLVELAAEQGFDGDQVRTAVVDRLGKSLDDLTAAGADASHRGGDREAPADAAGAGGLARPAHRDTQSSGVVSSRVAPLLITGKGGHDR